MGKTYTDGIVFVTEECCSCGIPFAMTDDFRRRRLKDRKTFHCPAGHAQHYTGKSQEQKLREELERKQRELEAESGRAAALVSQRNTIARSYAKMRERVKNGVCPCCNRTFQNLLNHMKNQHPDFGSHQILKALRDTYGLTQRALADEIGLAGSQVSNYERQRPVAPWVAGSIESWIAENA